MTDIKKILKEASDKPEWIKSFCVKLRLSFGHMVAITTSNLAIMKDLNYLDKMALCYPFLLKVLHHKEIGSEEFEKLAGFLEKIVFRVKLISSRAVIETRLSPHLIKHLNSECDVDALINDIAKLIRDGRWDYWGKQNFEAKLSGWFYDNPVDNYLLWKYEGSLKNKGNANIDFNVVEKEQIEHISPKTPTDGKPIENGYDIYDDDFLKNYLHCVGNLMLIGAVDNIVLSNHAFSIKLASYNSVGNALSQHKEIATEFIRGDNPPIWNKTKINERKEKIIKFAYEKWGI